MVKARVRPRRTNIRQKGTRANGEWASLRLRDRIGPGVRVLFVGINPGVRSAMTGHHFAGYSNRFWKLLWEARLVPERITYLDDDRLAEWGYRNHQPGAARRAPESTISVRPSTWTDGARSSARFVDSSPASSRSSASRFTARSGRSLASDEWRRPRASSGRWPSGCGRRRSIGGARVRACPTRAAAMPTSATRRCWSAFKGLRRRGPLEEQS